MRPSGRVCDFRPKGSRVVRRLSEVNLDLTESHWDRYLYHTGEHCMIGVEQGGNFQPTGVRSRDMYILRITGPGRHISHSLSQTVTKHLVTSVPPASSSPFAPSSPSAGTVYLQTLPLCRLTNRVLASATGRREAGVSPAYPPALRALTFLLLLLLLLAVLHAFVLILGTALDDTHDL